MIGIYITWLLAIYTIILSMYPYYRLLFQGLLHFINYLDQHQMITNLDLLSSFIYTGQIYRTYQFSLHWKLCILIIITSNFLISKYVLLIIYINLSGYGHNKC